MLEVSRTPAEGSDGMGRYAQEFSRSIADRSGLAGGEKNLAADVEISLLAPTDG
jgi:hypothetical protein